MLKFSFLSTSSGGYISLKLLTFSIIIESKYVINEVNYISKAFTCLTLLALCPSEICIKKLIYIFIFTLLCGASKGFMKTFKVFIKPFEASQRSVKIKILLNFFTLPGIGPFRVKKGAFFSFLFSCKQIQGLERKGLSYHQLLVFSFSKCL